MRGMLNRLWPVFLLLIPGCSGLKNATPERPLFASYEVRWEEKVAQDQRAITQELGSLVRPKPNHKVLGMRPTVALHNAIKPPKKPKGIRNLLKNKIGSAPVYLDQVPLKDINSAVENRMNNHGYFNARTEYTVEKKGRTARAIFLVYPGIPSRLRNISYGDGTDSLNARISQSQLTSPLHTDDVYDLSKLVLERVRVAGELRNAGWYRLKDDDLLFSADTASASKRVDLLLRVKPAATEAVRQRYTIGRVRVHGDYDAQLTPNDSTWVDSVTYINYLNNYRPATIVRGVFLRPGEFYSARQTEQTMSYLSSYGVFRSTTVNYSDDTLHKGILRADVILVPQKRWSLFSELNAISKSNNFAGPGLRAGLKDRDLFHGAELFTADLNGRFETQIAGARKGTNAYELGAKLVLQFPRIVPILRARNVRSSAPLTRAELGYGLFRRIGLYGLESFNTSFGWVIRQTTRKWHDVHLLDVSYNSLYYSSDEFTAFLDTNQAIRRSFEEQFILGVGYTYTVSTQRRNSATGHVLASLGFDEGGNIPSVLYRISGPRPSDGDRMFGNRFSQFVRFRPELRYYRPIGAKGDQFVARLLVNVAVPYGNSQVVPYVKQFFTGGTNSVRAFRARSVGPGTYVPDRSNNVQIDQVGDIKLEANAEWRFTIAGYFKGALFADAGNIWLVNDDPQRPGGKFDPKTALSELAVGGGFGLRFDPNVIVVRLDLATPFRDPALPVDDRWTFNHQKPRLFDNLVFNIAVGYPF